MKHYHGYEEYRMHPLFQIARGLAIERAQGRCEECERIAVLEAHHEKYPAWGAFDTPANMRAICHECHCKRHGKRD